MGEKEIYSALIRAIGEHMDTKGRAAVSVNGRPALIITIDRETGEVTARNAITDTTAADAVIDYLNTVAGTKYQKTPKNRSYINARIAEDHTPEDCRRVIDSRWAMWKGTSMQEYMRPCTLFNSEKFEGYLAAAKTNVKKIAGSYFMNHIQHQYSADELAKIGVDLIGDLGED
jgi:uncharacterized phage protein (TIGR02220 family)|nr:MAG TPA: hypothetical protein [Caudoviricetes sp.]